MINTDMVVMRLSPRISAEALHSFVANTVLPIGFLDETVDPLDCLGYVYALKVEDNCRLVASCVMSQRESKP